LTELAPFRGRTAYVDAQTLIELFGDRARAEAAERAGRSRDLGNVIHFCRWREAGRMIELLSGRAVAGAVH
jgi:hypothetical protein